MLILWGRKPKGSGYEASSVPNAGAKEQNNVCILTV